MQAAVTDLPLAQPLLDLLGALTENGTEIEDARVPNPFYGVASETFIDSDAPVLTLVDGGEDGESTPLTPLLVKTRGVDVILAIDIVSPAVSIGAMSRIHNAPGWEHGR